MADFRQAILLTLQHEGGFVDNPNDKGGATKFGITQRDIPDKDISDITTDDAVAYYEEHYWKALYSGIQSQSLANKIFDMGVLFGVGTAVRLLQTVLHIEQTEIFDAETLAAANHEGDEILPIYIARLLIHAQWIVNTEPNQKEFLQGWENRIRS